MADAMKIGAGGVVGKSTVTIEDAVGMSILRIDHNAWPAGLDPDQAVALATQIIASARRVRALRAAMEKLPKVRAR